MQTAAVALLSMLIVGAAAQAAEPPRAPDGLPPFPSVDGGSPPYALGTKPPGAPASRPADKPHTADQAARPRPDSARRGEPPRGRVCFNAADTREKIAAHRLTEPFRALRAGRAQGEALRARLCRWKPDEFVYEISVLRRDGRVVHIYMNAENGQMVGALNDNDRK